MNEIRIIKNKTKQKTNNIVWVQRREKRTVLSTKVSRVTPLGEVSREIHSLFSGLTSAS